MSFGYVGKVGKIYVTTLPTANTWVKVLTKIQAKGIRAFKIKSRMTFTATGRPKDPPRPFDYAFVESPVAGDTAKSGNTELLGNAFWSNAGTGAGDEIGTMNAIYARSAFKGTIIEVVVAE